MVPIHAKVRSSAAGQCADVISKMIRRRSSGWYIPLLTLLTFAAASLTPTDIHGI
jgi:hypothetical protein